MADTMEKIELHIACSSDDKAADWYGEARADGATDFNGLHQAHGLGR